MHSGSLDRGLEHSIRKNIGAIGLGKTTSNHIPKSFHFDRFHWNKIKINNLEQELLEKNLGKTLTTNAFL